VLLFVLERILKLLHPFMPFITEEIWQKIPHEGESIMVSSWPEELELEEDLETRTRMERLMGVVTAIRNIRGEMGVPPSKRIKAILRSEDARILEELQQEAPYIRSLALLRELELLEGGEAPKASSTAITYGVEVYVPLSELVPEPEKEIERLKKELKRVEEDIAFLSRKLQDPSFLQKAPKEVVEKEKEKLEERLKVREKLQMRLNAVEDLLGLR
jgi:valyl-tRNA synthetase